MTPATHILEAAEQGDPSAAEKLLPLVYDELRRIAVRQLAQEKPGQTLQPTALVHEAYLRLVAGSDRPFEGRTHFFAAAAEAMRRILIENARRKGRLKRGGRHRRINLRDVQSPSDMAPDELLAMDEALTAFAKEDPDKAELVQLRFFGGLSVADAAKTLGIARATADRWWVYARAWLGDRLGGSES
jgi:RNA polymerase sigma factor (TIGR02999 family)